ncbi:MAG: polyprenyl synthetase family protein [Mycobacteriaceae bacterium]
MSTQFPPVSIPDLVTTCLTEFFEIQRPVVANVGVDYESAVHTLESFVLSGGKRVRPAFAYWGYVGALAEPQNTKPHPVNRSEVPSADDHIAAIKAFSALELVQACALIHDDIIDASATRRGLPTIHVKFAQDHSENNWPGSSKQFGEGVGILLGDLALSWADDLLHSSGLSPEAMARVTPVWSAMRTEVLGGQYLDILAEASSNEDFESAMAINTFKTAAYTIKRPLQIGAAIAGADQLLMDSYADFGTSIGIAFQLRDDLLGVFGDPEITGKPSGDDLREGKRTVLLATALRAADKQDPSAAHLIRSSIGKNLSEHDISQLRSVIKELGAVDEAEQQIDELTTSALTALENSTATSPAKSALTALALAATQRNS